MLYMCAFQSDLYKITAVDDSCSVDECQEYKKLVHAMELVGFAADIRTRLALQLTVYIC